MNSVSAQAHNFDLKVVHIMMEVLLKNFLIECGNRVGTKAPSCEGSDVGVE